MASKVLFIDRDGTLVEEPADFQIDRIEKIRLMKNVIPALLEMRSAGYQFVMVSNQDGLGTPAFPQVDFDISHRHILALFSSQGIEFDEVFICPHFEEDACGCRKPKAGLLANYLAKTHLSIADCAVVGDRSTDLELAEAIGVRGFLVSTDAKDGGNWTSVVAALLRSKRTGSVSRQTNETNISVDVNLDRASPIVVSTGIGFLDHMLQQISKHAGFALQVRCNGDLDVDEHHTVEDVAICLGSALKKALGDKRGICRFGFLLPMDESEAKVTLDLSGRAHFSFSGEFGREAVGGLPTELVPHFFQSFAESLGAALHIEVQGNNAHHMIEACFKSVGRTLRQAIRLEGTELPTTKGLLS